VPGKRKHRRIIKRLNIECSAGGADIKGISSCVSGNGLFVRTSKPFPPDTTVDLTIHLTDHDVSRVRGVVRATIQTGLIYGKNGMGIEIVQYDQNFVTFMNSLLPVGERIQQKEVGVGAAPELSMEKPVASSQGVAAGHSKSETSPHPKGRPAASANSKSVESDETIDSLLSSLFRNGDKK
jgi:hypothetical protein